MRHLHSDSLVSTIKRGASIEQFMRGVVAPDRRRVRWLEIKAAFCGFELWEYMVSDVGDFEHLDIYSWMSDDDGALLKVAKDAVEIIEFAHTQLGARADRWVNQFVIQDEYGDFLKQSDMSPR